MRILLISAYEARSHKAWANSIMNGLGEHDWTYLALPARHFAWRIRGNALSLAFDPEYKSVLQQSYDLVIATSMTDCVGLKAFCPSLQSVPWLLYFHENQFAYPFSDKQQGMIEMQMVTLYSALAADICIFNSAFNKSSFFKGARALLKKLPDHVSPDWLNTIEEKAKVIPVPLDELKSDRVSESPISSPLRLVWSARWEYDKGPDRLLAILRELDRREIMFEIAILGEQFRSVPEEFSVIRQEFTEQIVQFGYAQSRDEYLAFLASADLVLSTALHEFQGLAVLEAVVLGCVPILPNRQVYPELFGRAYLYESDLKDKDNEAKSAVDLIESFQKTSPRVPDISDFQGEKVLHLYRQCLQTLTA